MNEVIELLMQHRSIRKFTNVPIPDDALEAILKAGQMASTSSNVQAYSIINIKDPSLRGQIMKLSGDQAYVAECPVFLVWCADLNRLNKAVETYQKEQQLENETLYADSTENLLVATIDAALAAQNAVVAAESLGYGAVYIGGIRNHIEQVSELLQLPQFVYPVFGMCLGVPDQKPLLRPRLPLEAILHTDVYDADRAQFIKQYDEAYADYMLKRSGGKSNLSWSAQMHKRLIQPIRLHMKEFLRKKGFMQK